MSSDHSDEVGAVPPGLGLHLPSHLSTISCLWREDLRVLTAALGLAVKAAVGQGWHLLLDVGGILPNNDPLNYILVFEMPWVLNGIFPCS